MKSILTFVPFLLQSINNSSSFIIQPSFSRGSISPNTHNQRVRVIVEEPFSCSSISSTALSAQKKKRRRRKDSSPSSTTQNDSESTRNTSENEINSELDDELPDFDLFEDEIDDTTSQSSTTTSSLSSSISTTKIQDIDPNDPAILAAMKATKGSESFIGSSGGNTKDLLRNRNRELEQKLVVDEVTQEVPSLAEYNAKKGGRNGSTSGPKMGKKALRREQAIAAAQEAERQKMEEENGIFSKLPFIGGSNSDSTEEKEEKSAIKVRPFFFSF